MAYKVRARRDGDGYSMEYGKGQKKIAHRLLKVGNMWRFVDAPKELMGKFALLDAAKQAFETYAGKAYGGPIEANPLIDSEVSDKGTILETSEFGPPPTLPPAVKPKANLDACDPFDPDNWTKIEGLTFITEVGAMREAWSWADSRYTPDEMPQPFQNLRSVLQRKYPDDMAYRLPVPAKARK